MAPDLACKVDFSADGSPFLKQSNVKFIARAPFCE
jgi:hypothetical protein